MNADPLELRLEVIERGVGDVQAVLKAGAEVVEALRDARNKASRTHVFVRDVNEYVSNTGLIATVDELTRFLQAIEDNRAAAQMLARQGIENNTGEWTASLAAISRKLQGYRDLSADGSKLLGELRADLLRIEHRVSFSSLALSDEAFGRRIGERIGDLTEAIGSLRGRLKANDPPEGAWKTYFDEIEPEAQRVFADYLDLLGGVSIRERGLAIAALADVCQLDNMCELADWHFKNELTLCHDLEGSFTAFPGVNVGSDVPPWPILRLGFASWSIWGLSLAGYEFGKLAADRKISERGERALWAKEQDEFGVDGLRTLIADTLAAWAEGPAYGCALLYLVLKPTAGGGEGATGAVTDAERADVVWRVLNDQAGDRRDGGYDYVPFLKRLRPEWYRRAPKGKAATPRSRLLAELPARVKKSFNLNQPFSLEDWKTAKTVLTYFETGAEVPADEAAGVRHLTNAAWRCRLSPELDLEPEDIEKRALGAGMALIQPPTDRQTTGGTDALKGGSAA
ncbi:MAG: hypothetical protein ACRD12_06230 [Acidimicrobiales bacterium]